MGVRCWNISSPCSVQGLEALLMVPDTLWGEAVNQQLSSPPLLAKFLCLTKPGQSAALGALVLVLTVKHLNYFRV